MESATAVGLKRMIPDAFREVLLLEKVQAAVESRSSEQQKAVSELAAAVDARAAAADTLSTPDQVPAALELLRDATVLAIRALLVARGREPAEVTPEPAFAELATLIESGALAPAPAELERARALLTETRPLAFDELSDKDAAVGRLDVEATLAWLRRQFDARTVSQIKMARWMRVGTIALIFVAALIGLGAWTVGKISSRGNIALGKPVQMSSRRPACPPSSGSEGLPSSGFTDGSKSSSYDICTNHEMNPWVTVDLQKSQSVKTVKVYNRGDCCWGSYDLPQVLEISEDGANYTPLERRTTAYTQAAPWVVSVGGKNVRFVRVRSDAAEPRELVLSEIEVFTR